MIDRVPKYLDIVQIGGPKYENSICSGTLDTSVCTDVFGYPNSIGFSGIYPNSSLLTIDMYISVTYICEGRQQEYI